MTYDDLKKALHQFGFHESDRLSIRQIRQRHRQLVRKHHPDANSNADPEQIRQLNAAARLLMDYLQDYHFAFSAEEFYQQRPEERLRQQFSWDPVWAGKKES
ncbi:molecular chaperone DnaJ [Desulfuromonas thiophila]|uniref:J domain-containing protein n=1 Tax=Desulfuromonas thiophila TaxID=57664 RepID=A0A1G6ZV41_9BACT|nr:molecular chaperone DnaJ [Desulfuromonas thiophila]SDE06390.1 hypothetical protein SAMN05661003_103140 [Desulfuromonas thiophila]